MDDGFEVSFDYVPRLGSVIASIGTWPGVSLRGSGAGSGSPGDSRTISKEVALAML